MVEAFKPFVLPGPPSLGSDGSRRGGRKISAKEERENLLGGILLLLDGLPQDANRIIPDRNLVGQITSLLPLMDGDQRDLIYSAMMSSNLNGAVSAVYKYDRDYVNNYMEQDFESAQIGGRKKTGELLTEFSTLYAQGIAPSDQKIKQAAFYIAQQDPETQKLLTQQFSLSSTNETQKKLDRYTGHAVGVANENYDIMEQLLKDQETLDEQSQLLSQAIDGADVDLMHQVELDQIYQRMDIAIQKLSDDERFNAQAAIIVKDKADKMHELRPLKVKGEVESLAMTNLAVVKNDPKKAVEEGYLVKEAIEFKPLEGNRSWSGYGGLQQILKQPREQFIPEHPRAPLLEAQMKQEPLLTPEELEEAYSTAAIAMTEAELPRYLMRFAGEDLGYNEKGAYGPGSPRMILSRDSMQQGISATNLFGGKYNVPLQGELLNEETGEREPAPLVSELVSGAYKPYIKMPPPSIAEELEAILKKAPGSAGFEKPNTISKPDRIK